MTTRLDTSMLRRIVALVLLDTCAFAYLAGAAVYVLIIYGSPAAEPFWNARHFLLPPVVSSLVFASIVLLITGTIREVMIWLRFRDDVMLRLGIRCAARFPVMLGLTCFATGVCFFVALAAMSTLTGSDWIGPPPSKLPGTMLFVSALLCWFVFCPLAYVVGERCISQFRLAAEHVLRYYCPACGYDLSGLKAGAVCPECGKPAVEPGESQMENVG